ncbi:MAG: hypothetical protein R3B07_23635 [Polyangiaceae bacterium]
MSSPESSSTLYRTLAVLALALFSIWAHMIALFVLVIVIISTAALPKLEKSRSLLYGLHALALVASLVGLVRFVIRDAVPGVVEAGDRAASKQAVSKLRGLVVAEDVLRRLHRVDPDGDGVGSAALIPELGGDVPLRDQPALTAPLLNRELSRLVDTPLGPAAHGGAYLYLICLPRAGGGWTARPGDPIDEEQAERRWVGYAWPSAETVGLYQTYFIDEHERILEFPNNAPKEPRYLGPQKPPSCDAALDGKESWTAWNGKKPRDHLPGDKP